MDNPERQIVAVGFALAYAFVWAVALVLLFRVGVAGLWGSGHDWGLIAAVALAAVGMLALAWLAAFLVRDWKKRFPKEP